MTSPAARSGGRPVQLGVVGAGRCDLALDALAWQVGREVARAGAILACGGLGGVMEAACRGAAEEGGLTLGILPGSDPSAANRHVRVVVPTGMGEARNVLVVRAAQALIALPGGAGTLSEVALAAKTGRPVIGLRAWGHVDGVQVVEEPAAAVVAALAAARA